MGKKICRMVGLILTLAVVLSVFSACGSERKIIDSSDLTSETEIIGTENQVSTDAETSGDGSESSSDLRFGVTSKNKMPNFISKVKDNKWTIISSADQSDSVIVNQQKKAFKKVTGIDIDIEYLVVPWDKMPERVAAMVMAGSAPDLFSYSGTSWLDLLKQPYWDDLNTYIDFNDALWKDTANVNNGIGDYNGKRVGLFTMSYSYCSNAMLYNTKLVEEAAEGNPSLYDPLEMFYEGKWTWDALSKYVNEISDSSAGIYGIALPDNKVSGFISTTGNDIIKIDKDKKLIYNLDNADVVRAFNYTKELIKMSDMPGTWQGTDMLLNNTLGFFCDINGAYALYASPDTIAATKSGKLSAVPFPRDEKSDAYYVASLSDSTSIPLKAKNPWLAAAWIYFQRYSYYNENADLQKVQEKLFKETYGWSNELYMMLSPEKYPNNFKNTKTKYSTDVTAFGERLSDFDQAGYWSLATDTNVLTSTLIEQVGPSLKTAIARYNNK